MNGISDLELICTLSFCIISLISMIKIQDYIDKNRIDTLIETLPNGSRIKHQVLKSNKNIELITFEFNKSNKLQLERVAFLMRSSVGTLQNHY